MRKDKGTRIAIPFLSIYSTPVNVLQHNSDTSYAELDPTNERSGSSTRCFHFRCWLQVGSWDTCTADQLATNQGVPIASSGSLMHWNDSQSYTYNYSFIIHIRDRQTNRHVGQCLGGNAERPCCLPVESGTSLPWHIHVLAIPEAPLSFSIHSFYWGVMIY